MSKFQEELTARLNAPDNFEIPAASPGQLSAIGRRTAAPPAYDLDMRVFTLYWPNCKACKGGNEFEGPAAYDAVCPHTERVQYLAVLQACRDKGWVLLHWKEETLKSGIVQASMTWGVPRETTKPEKPKRVIPTL